MVFIWNILMRKTRECSTKPPISIICNKYHKLHWIINLSHVPKNYFKKNEHIHVIPLFPLYDNYITLLSNATKTCLNRKQNKSENCLNKKKIIKYNSIVWYHGKFTCLMRTPVYSKQKYGFQTCSMFHRNKKITSCL